MFNVCARMLVVDMRIHIYIYVYECVVTHKCIHIKSRYKCVCAYESVRYVSVEFK